MPEISGTITNPQDYSLNAAGNNFAEWMCNGAFDYVKKSATTISTGTGTYPAITEISFKASRSNNIFGNADTVQPPAIVLIPQIKF